MSKTVQDYLDKLGPVTVRSVWAKMPEMFVDGWGKEHQEPAALGMIIGWAADGIGFGELTFTFTEEGSICDSETMPTEFVEAVLIKLARSTDLKHKLDADRADIDAMMKNDET